MTTREPTEFEQLVYAAAKKIPRGKVTTYKMLADHIGCGAAIAVGQALKRNPFAPKVPCHRIIASDLTIGGFAGERSGPEIDRKTRLLAAEGVRFENNRLVDQARALYNFGNSI